MQERTVYSLLVEFWEDYYEKNPLEARRDASGEVVFTDTGDELIDRWEKQLAEGGNPNLMEAFSSADLERLERLRNKGKEEPTIIGSTPYSLG